MAFFQTKFKFSKIYCHENAILMVFNVLTIIAFGIFLYLYFYQALADIKRITALQNDVVVEKVSAQIYDSVVKNYETKKAAPKTDWESFKNPFLPYAASNSAETEPETSSKAESFF